MGKMKCHAGERRKGSQLLSSVLTWAPPGCQQAFCLQSYGQSREQRKDRKEVVAQRMGSWWEGGRQRKRRNPASTEGAASREGWRSGRGCCRSAFAFPLPLAAPRSHPAPSRHLLRRRQRVVFL